MPPRLNLLGFSRTLAIRTRPSIASHNARFAPVAPFRGFADEKGPAKPQRPNQDQLPHVSEEAAEISKTTGETAPDLEQGTPVKEASFPRTANAPGSKDRKGHDISSPYFLFFLIGPCINFGDMADLQTR